MSVAELCASIDDARALRIALVEELRSTTPFDSYAWLLTDPETEVGASPVADVPCLPELPRLIRLKYATQVNRWTAMSRPVERLHAVTGGRLEQSQLWSELLVEHEVTDLASVVFRDRFGCWSFLDLWRTAGVFTEREARLLEAHVDTVTAALRRCTLRTFSRSTPRDTAPPRNGPIVLMLSDQLEVRAQTAETERLLRTLVPPEGNRPAVPAGAYNVAAQLLAVEAGIGAHPPTARVHLGDGHWLTLRAARMDDDIAVTIETASPVERLDLYGRSAGLSVRETELLDLLVAGNDTRAIAKGMFVSEHTVQDHLKSIFSKTGAGSRRELLAAAVGS